MPTKENSVQVATRIELDLGESISDSDREGGLSSTLRSPDLAGHGLKGRLCGLAHTHFPWMRRHEYPEHCLPVLVGGYEDGHRDVEAAGYGEVSSWRHRGRSSRDTWSITPSSTKPGNGHVYYSAEVLITGVLGILESVEIGRKRGKWPLKETVGP